MLSFSCAAPQILLTADVHTFMEGLGNLRVHFNQKVSLLSELFISNFYFSPDPLAEALPYDCIDNIDQPLPRNLVHVPVFREVVINLWRLPCLRENADNVQRLILRDIEHLD
mgnify:FL=1